MKNSKKIFHQILLTDITSDGRCIGKTEDYHVIFVKNTVPGDLVDIEVQKKKNNFYEGSVLCFHQLSQERTIARCVHFGLCGGCKWQNLKYSTQLIFKQKQVRDHFERIAGFSSPEVLPVLASQEQYGYRNKMEFSFSSLRWLSKEEIESGINISNKRALGFHINNRWDKVLDIKECHLHTKVSEDIRIAVKNYTIKTKWSFYDFRKKKGFLRNLMIRHTSIGEIMVLLHFFYEKKEKREALLYFLQQKFPNINALLYVINNKPNDAIHDLKVNCFYGRSFIYEIIGHVRFKIDAKTFFQTNSNQALLLFKTVRDYAEFNGKEIVYDLYTGVGTIAQFIAANVKKVIGIESVPEAIDRSRENAVLNAIKNCHFFCGDIKDIFNCNFISHIGK